MSKAQLIIEVTTKDGAVKQYSCRDFPKFSTRHMTLYVSDGEHSLIDIDTVDGVRSFLPYT